MTTVTETTFKNLQMDERYKKLERTLKMVLLRNSESRSGPDNTNGTWPSISSINGDNLDTSCTAQSIQSSRLCSEVVSSSLNLRNIMMNKKQFNGSPKNIATSSENQYPTSKEVIDDNAMMPPPRLPGLSLTRSKRISEEMPRSPLTNAAMNRNDHNFSMSRMASAASVSKCNDVADVIQSCLPSNEKDYHCGRSYDESGGDTQLVQVQERIFRKWRVLLNDKGQLIIKGTLECGKIARSKPVIRRLTPTSVQSIFKHIYHLRGNLVDERNELPDYVSGKFCNGFPEDWENVYQVWRNYVGEGSRLSFRWPTPVTDSDDDIKSEITEISNNPNLNKRNKLRSPRKRSRSFQTLSTTSRYVVNKENQSENQLRSFSQIQNGPVESPLKPLTKASNSFSNNRSRDSRFENDPSDAKFDKVEPLRETSTANFDNDRKSMGNSLKDIIQEDKINLIIDNLTNKNCSQEYIQKIVEMFDCMKYVVSYQSTSSENSNSVAKPSTEFSRSPTEKNQQNRSTKRMNDRETIGHSSSDKIDCRENQSREIDDRSRNIGNKSNGPVYGGKVRRKSIHNDSSESGNDYDDSPDRSSIEPYSLSNYGMRKIREPKEYKRSSVGMNQPYHNSGRSFDPSRRPYVESTPITKDYNPSETFSMTNKSVLQNSICQYPSKRRFMEEHENSDTYHSSICITEDENENGGKKMYDSSVSITEDEHCDVRGVQEDLRSSKYCPEQKSHPAKSDFRGMEDQKKLMYYPETNFHSHGAKIDRDTSGRKNSISRRSVAVNRRASADISVRMTMNQSIDDHGREHFEDSAHKSSEVKLQKESDPIYDTAETESNSLCPLSCSKKFDSRENLKTSEVLLTKKSRDCQKPVAVSSEIVNVNLRPLNSPRTKDQTENHKKADVLMDKKSEPNQASMGPKNAQNSESILAETKITQTMITRSRDKETGSKIRDGKSSTGERNSENVEQTKNPKKAALAKFGSEENPKKLTGWVPAVICDNENGDVKCHLIFEGKLINEAGHVVSRRFTTDFVKRRLSSKSIETVDHVFYRLVGDMNDTKHVVPADLIKLCRTGCPSKIDNFCEKWKSLVPGSNETLSALRAHNTSVDCLSLPTSSRGRRILPPLNYWDGERITTKDNKAIYSPGNCQESSIPSSLEKTNDENLDKSNSPPRTKGKRIQDSTATKNKNKGSEKIVSPDPSESHTKNSVQPRNLQTSTNGKRKLARKMHQTSSESDEEEKIRFRKRKTRKGASTLSAETESREKLQNHTGNATSLPSLRQSRSSQSGSFEKRPATETKTKLRKRPKVDKDDGQMTPEISKQLTTREASGVTCTFYNNVPMLDDDLSEDQLSSIM